MTSIGKILREYITLALFSPIAASPALAQINFGVYTTSDITLSVNGGGTTGTLNFNDKQPDIAPNSNAVTISPTDNDALYIAVTGDATRDITVEISAPASLASADTTIPFSYRFAYWNRGSASVTTAQQAAVQVPSGFTSATFPLLLRSSGAPLPPPTPAHGGYTAPQATAYLFLGGTLGNLGGKVGGKAGTYSGTININVNYTTY